MNHNQHNPCYGTMLPDPRLVSRDGGGAGKVFSLHVDTPPGLGPRHPQVRENLAEWDNCLGCPEFDSCYRLSLARVALQGLAEDL